MKINIIILDLIFFFTLTSISYAKKYEFDNIIIFGDSLSDQGFFKNKIAIADANNNDLYPEYLSLLFTGKHSIPNNELNKNGNNYAIIGSTVVSKNDPNKKIYYGINNFLQKTNNKVNPNNIYIIWAGGNDIAQDIEVFFKNIFNKNIKSSINNAYNSPINIKENAIKLINNGAKYVIVPNIFNATLGPVVINIRHLILASLNNSTKYLIFKSNINIDNDLRKSNNIQNIIGEGTGKKFIRSKQTEILNGINILGSLLNEKLKSSEIIINTFNSTLENELKSINKSIVFINIYELFNNIIDNPKFYGIDDIIMPICPFDIIEQSCSLGSKYYYNDKNYLWSDMIHPSPFMHIIYAQYMESVFNAPVLISSISKHLTAINNNNQDYILNHHLFNNNKDNNIVNKIISFISINGLVSKIGDPYDYNSRNTNTNSLNIGLTHVTTKALFGLMLNLSLNNIKPYDNFKYKYNSEILNLFSKYYIGNKWLNAILNIGQINATDIRRAIILGKGVHIENSNTKGKSIGINFSVGYDFNYKGNINLTPYINLDLHNYKINSFSEKDNKSTSMKYYKSNTTLKEIKLAFRFNKQNNTLKHFIELGIAKNINNKPIKIKSSLKSTQTYFIREIFISKNPYLNLNIGFDKKFENNNISININLNFKINKDKDKQLIYALGINKKF